MKSKREVSKDLDTLIQAYEKVEGENLIFKEALEFLSQQKKNIEKAEPRVSIEVKQITLEKLKVFGSGIEDWDAVINRVLDLVPRQASISEEDPVRGEKGAQLAIIAFTDFDCMHCKLALPTIERLLMEYKGKVRFVFKNFPRTLKHPDAALAHEAALCAKEQGKFWEYHDLLFANQKQLKKGNLIKLAKEAGLDAGRFKFCLESGINTSKVFQDVKEGFDLGVRRVPTFFVGSKRLEGNVAYEEFKAAIEEELGKLQKQAID